jgi:hypothetical protein
MTLQLHTEPNRTVEPTPGAFAVAAVLRDNSALGRAHDVDVRAYGDTLLAFVTGKAGSFAVVDVSNPRLPRVLGSIVEGIENGETVLPLGDVCLIGSSHLHAVDVRDPRRPVVTAWLPDERISSINGMVLWGPGSRYAIAASKRGHVNVFDLTDPFHPTLFTSFASRQLDVLVSPHDVALLGSEHIVVVDQRGGSPLKVAVIRIATPGAERPRPADEWVVESTLAGEEMDGANRVAVKGSALLVACNKSDRMAVVDARDISHLVEVANFTCPDDNPCGITLTGNVLFVAGGQALEALDVSDPHRPQSLGWCRPLDVFPTRDGYRGDAGSGYQGTGSKFGANAHDLVYRDGYVYVTAQNDNILGVIEVTNPRINALARGDA